MSLVASRTFSTSWSIMKQWTNDEISTEQIEDSSKPPPQKRAKRQPGDNLQEVEATSFNADISDNYLYGAERVANQLSNYIVNMINHQPAQYGIVNFILPSEEDCALAPEENLGPNFAGLKSSQTGTSLWRSRLLLTLRENHCLAI